MPSLVAGLGIRIEMTCLSKELETGLSKQLAKTHNSSLNTTHSA